MLLGAGTAAWVPCQGPAQRTWEVSVQGDVAVRNQHQDKRRYRGGP